MPLGLLLVTPVLELAAPALDVGRDGRQGDIGGRRKRRGDVRLLLGRSLLLAGRAGVCMYV